MKPTETTSATEPGDDDSSAARARRKQGAIRELIARTGRDGSGVYGRLPNDELTREAWELGEAWRKSEDQ